MTRPEPDPETIAMLGRCMRRQAPEISAPWCVESDTRSEPVTWPTSAEYLPEELPAAD